MNAVLPKDDFTKHLFYFGLWLNVENIEYMNMKFPGVSIALTTRSVEHRYLPLGMLKILNQRNRQLYTQRYNSEMAAS